MNNDRKTLRLFVYGTLKSGFPQHRHYCGPDARTYAATVPGHLYHLPQGYPAATVPADTIIAHGSADPDLDASLQDTHQPHPETGPNAPRIHGQVVELDDPGRLLPAIDDYEGFTPDGTGDYLRVLVTADTAEGPRTVWMYAMKSVRRGLQVPGGRWPEGMDGLKG
ncbi:gamma-glutamylcyclotransferase family protein [Desulfovibrio oxyclinae]|uniref:gamma-glutamylcyclotransferase family protein n=1 Tax=Desulfovibrio oxyclinae TaxID=63560 RepID=UPI00035EF384|nr:gamma-glutamylcyclotransferase family protein [Desulfovibrio oxyclinae]